MRKLCSSPGGNAMIPGFGQRRQFKHLSEQEVLALAIASEEDDGRIYRWYAQRLRTEYPQSARVFEDMAVEEDGHRAELIEEHRRRFGETIPLIRREHVAGFYNRRPVWLVQSLSLERIRDEAARMEMEAHDFYQRAAQRTSDAGTRSDSLATFGMVRVGVAMKNVRAPEFGTGDDQMTLKRQARAGLALVGHSNGAINQLALAVDADLTKTTTVVGDERHVAGGIEAFTLQRHVALRAGLSANTIGAARVSPSVGASLGVRNGVYFEGQLTGGSDEARHGWGLDLRVTF